MSAAATMPGYELVLAGTNDGPEALKVTVRRTHSLALQEVARGLTVNALAQLVQRFFPVCARAHAGAVLAAGERAGGLKLAPGQTEARKAVILAEAVAACVWRMGLSWSEHTGLAPVTGAVCQARKASQDIATGLFTGDWAVLGGGAMRIDRHKLNTALGALREAVEACDTQAETLMLITERLEIVDGVLPAPLGPRLLDACTRPDEAAFEESPRTSGRNAEPASGLQDWFWSQWALARALLDDLSQVIGTVQPEAPAPATGMRDGTGLGVTQTARGRLRHGLTLTEGRVTDWHIASPSDWNMAQDGVMERLAGIALNTGEPARFLPFVVAAIDPCLPCRVIAPGREVGDA